MYILMNKNTEVLSFMADDELYATEVFDIINNDYMPIGIKATTGSLNKWISNRCIPASRDRISLALKNVSDCINQNATPNYLLKKCFGLSLSDQYWIKPYNSDLKWENINFFTNDFSSDIGKIIFDNKHIRTPDLRSPDNSSAGWLQKKWVIENNSRYLIKGSSYFQQEAINEVIATSLCKRLSIPCTEYTAFSKGHKTFSKCECFITSNTELVSASAILNSNDKLDKSANKYNNFVDSCVRLGIPDITCSLDDMLVIDFIIANQDRHFGNFGVIRNIDSLSFTSFAPLYDNGTSLRYDTPTQFINERLSIESQPFEQFHSQQIKLVQNKDKYDFSFLSDFSDEVVSIFKVADYYDIERALTIKKVVSQRIKMIEKLFCKNYYNGYTEPLDLTQNNKFGR